MPVSWLSLYEQRSFVSDKHAEARLVLVEGSSLSKRTGWGLKTGGDRVACVEAGLTGSAELLCRGTRHTAHW